MNFADDFTLAAARAAHANTIVVQPPTDARNAEPRQRIGPLESHQIKRLPVPADSTIGEGLAAWVGTP